jgi:hypothetical protein
MSACAAHGQDGLAERKSNCPTILLFSASAEDQQQVGSKAVPKQLLQREGCTQALRLYTIVRFMDAVKQNANKLDALSQKQQ